MTYSLDFRKKVLQIREEKGLSIVKTANLFSISPTTIVKWKKNIIPKVSRNKQATKIDMEALKKDIKANSDSYNYERAQRLGVSTTCVLYALKRLGITYKKNSESPQKQRRRSIYLSTKDYSL